MGMDSSIQLRLAAADMQKALCLDQLLHIMRTVKPPSYACWSRQVMVADGPAHHGKYALATAVAIKSSRLVKSPTSCPES